LLLLFSYFPTGTSIYEFEQYVQIAQSKNFQKFDYGKEKNVEIYGQSEPPTYNLSKIKLPVRLLYGEEDSLTSQEV
jgi:lysosomal acid lipase/cholesteryl ester hydrolase